MPSEHDEPASGRDELADFERQVASPRRVVGYVLAAFGAVGCCSATFLRMQASLGHEQWAWAGAALFWVSVALVALLFGQGRGQTGHATYDSMPDQVRIRTSRGLIAVLALSLVAAATDCGVAHFGAHALHKIYPPLVELRFDTDGAFLLYGIVLLAALR
ncbi:MAG TPA: hypothetical protein VK745_31855 [Polyangiaceae bacterium]|jgi:hypothetical protein|nr:hypothetical protein [Polyangiaceae bacterium]